MKEIKLTQNKVALVDDKDYEWLSQWKWCVRKGSNTFYAFRNIKVWGKWKVIQMHREILGFIHGDGKLTDHKNRNGLDNQKTNLRLTNRSLNAINSKLFNTNSSGYRGVYQDKRDSAWWAQIRVNYVKIHCGRYLDPVTAALAYDRVAIKYRGNNAILNFPKEN